MRSWWILRDPRRVLCNSIHAVWNSNVEEMRLSSRFEAEVPCDCDRRDGWLAFCSRGRCLRGILRPNPVVPAMPYRLRTDEQGPSSSPKLRRCPSSSSLHLIPTPVPMGGYRAPAYHRIWGSSLCVVLPPCATDIKVYSQSKEPLASMPRRRGSSRSLELTGR